jgi:hypothetical protein
VAARKRPYEDAPSVAVIGTWIASGETEAIPDDTPREFADLIRNCWQSNPDDRPNARDLLAPLESLLRSGSFFGRGAGASGGPRHATHAHTVTAGAGAGAGAAGAGASSGPKYATYTPPPPPRR